MIKLASNDNLLSRLDTVFTSDPQAPALAGYFDSDIT